MTTRHKPANSSVGKWVNHRFNLTELSATKGTQISTFYVFPFMNRSHRYFQETQTFGVRFSIGASYREGTQPRQGNRRYQTPPPVRCCPWWVSLSIRHCDKSTGLLLPIASLLRCSYLVIRHKHDVIHKTGSTSHRNAARG